MKNSVDLRDWQKVLLGFLAANIPHRAVVDLTDKFDQLPRDQAEKILAGGHFGESNNENRESRNLFRALNFLLAVRAMDQRLPYAVDQGRKGRFATGASSIGNLKQEVLAEYHRIFPPVVPIPAIPVPVANVVIVSAQTPIPRTRNAAIKQLEAALKINGGGRTVLRAVERFKEGAMARRKVVASFDNNAALSTAWFAAKENIYKLFAQDREFWLHRFPILQQALNLAYGNFSQNVRNSAIAIQARYSLIGSLFGALKHCPPPVSLLGVIGQAAMGQFKPDNYNPATKYAALKGDDKGVLGKIAEIMEMKEKAFTLVNCANIDKQTTLSEGLSRASTAFFKEMQYIANQVLDEKFGRPGELDAKLTAAKQAYLQRAGLSKQNPAAHHQEFFDTVIRQYADETIALIDEGLGWKPEAVREEDLRIAIEMYLYCQYVLALFGSEEGQAKDAYSLPVDDSIISFFAQAGDWGILSTITKDHKQSDAAGRLNWQGGENHMKALEMFCGWYVGNINPFMILSGASVDGRKCSPALIKNLCREHVGIINGSINSGRTVGFFGSKWDWNRIRMEYMTRTGALARAAAHAAETEWDVI